MGLPETSTENKIEVTSSVKPFVDVFVIPWGVDMFFFGESVDREAKLVLPPFDFSFGRRCLNPGVPTEYETEKGAGNKDLTSSGVGASEIGGDL